MKQSDEIVEKYLDIENGEDNKNENKNEIIENENENTDENENICKNKDSQDGKIKRKREDEIDEREDEIDDEQQEVSAHENSDIDVLNETEIINTDDANFDKKFKNEEDE
jgi:hypothetical protein